MQTSSSNKREMASKIEPFNQKKNINENKNSKHFSGTFDLEFSRRLFTKLFFVSVSPSF
jgi:hypothetical protein